ncbi:MAG: hypothetical protein SFY66_05875 [Oculatellaceae cyanobacterium bins.114]|nr:hypothetical protein [Oculatellaceae cyanobacterium bins.114]
MAGSRFTMLNVVFTDVVLRTSLQNVDGLSCCPLHLIVSDRLPHQCTV